MQTKNLPIGYWIKEADNLLTAGIDAIHSKAGITRTGWQVLHSIHENGSLHKAALFSLLSPFANQESLKQVLLKLADDNFIEVTDDILFLTPGGKQLHQQCFEQQKAFRQKISTGINEQDYQTTVLTLQRMVENLKV